jgi:pilus assembly protein Flp/PilA
MGIIKRLVRDEDGATAVEYGLIVGAIAGVIVVVVFMLGGKVTNAFNKVANKL